MTRVIPGTAVRLATMVGTFPDGTELVIERYARQRPYPDSPHLHWVRQTRYENGELAERKVSRYTGRNLEQLADTWADWETGLADLDATVTHPSHGYDHAPPCG